MYEFKFISYSIWTYLCVILIVGVIFNFKEYPQPNPSAMPVVSVKSEPLMAPLPWPFNCNSKKARSSDLHALACNIDKEAGIEDFKGKYAVGLVTMNRVMNPRFPNTIPDVVYEIRRSPTNGRRVAQFSWVLDSRTKMVENKRSWEDSWKVAHILLGKIWDPIIEYGDITEGSLNYHADYVRPFWSKRMEVATVIETHIFYYGN